MYSRTGVAGLGILALTSCAPHSSVPSGSVVLDEVIALSRDAQTDTATREITVDSDATLVAIVDENLTDVSLALAAIGPNDDAIEPVAVENHLAGAGLEIATLAVPRRARVKVTLTGPQNAVQPGSVHLRLRQFAPDAARDPVLASQLAGFIAWSSGTQASFRQNGFRKSGLAALDRAIEHLATPQGDARLAAEAELIKANNLQFFLVDVRQSLDVARHARAAFTSLGASAALQAARARRVEAIALSELAENPLSKNPTAQEARIEAGRLLEELSGEASPLGPIERARAVDGLGSLHQAQTMLVEARQYYESSRAMYAAAGYIAGETEMLAALAQISVENGEWNAAARAFGQMLPNVQKISHPVRRVKTLLSAGHALGFSGDPDAGMKLLLEAITQARDHELRSSEAEANWELAWLYWFRGDVLQAKALFTQSLKIARTLDNGYGLSSNLQTAGMVARREGDYDTAIALHKEAIPVTPTPFHRIRTLRDLALDYAAAGRYPEAIVELRNALAVKIQDPGHHIFTDIKRDLAEILIEHGDGSAATYAEATRLLADSMRMSVKMNDVRNQIGGHRVMARLATKERRYTTARTEFERAFELIFRFRTASANPQLRIEAVEQEQSAFRGYFDLMMRGVAADRPGAPVPASTQAQDALRMLERSRETRFGVPRRVALDAATSARVDALLAQMADRSVRISAMLAGTPDAKETAQLDALQMELARLRAEVDRERTAAAEQHVAGEAPADVAARPWRDVVPRAVQLSYALGNDHAYVWIRDTSGLRVAALSESPEAIERKLTELASFDPQSAPLKIEESLADMSGVLLPAGLIPVDSNALEIVAEGRIASVPFAGLRSPTDAARRLVETHSLTVITSMYSTEESHRSAQARPYQLVALASGSGTLRSARVADVMPKLQVATAEIQAIARLFEARDRNANIKLFAGSSGDASTLQNLWSSGVDVVHFATHALADLRQPLASLLVLPARDATGGPAYLTAGQVQEWRGDVDLVFLSACESAIGPPRFAGGMPGLQSAFLRAGARGVIATLWPIEDVLAREFTAEFYRRFTGGVSAVQALSDTQRAWLTQRAGDDVATQLRRRITALAHGYYKQ